MLRVKESSNFVTFVSSDDVPSSRAMAVTNIRYLLLFLQKHPENHTTPSLINYDQEQCIQTKSY